LKRKKKKSKAQKKRLSKTGGGRVLMDSPKWEGGKLLSKRKPNPKADKERDLRLKRKDV